MKITDKTARSLATACEWLLMAAFVVFFSALSLTKHAAFQTHGFDLGNYDQTVWNTLHGRILACTNWPPFGDSRLAFHVEPILILIAPLYLIYEGPQTLLVLQAVVTGLGAWPVAQMARRRLGTPWMGPVFAAVYLLFPALEAGPTFEFHAVTFAATFLGMALYAIEREHYVLTIPWLVLAAACKEEISLLVAMIGLYLVLIQRRYRLGLTVTLTSIAWFQACVQLILPHFNLQGESAHLGRYSYLGEDVPEIVMTILQHPKLLWDTLRQPARFAYLWRIPLPTGYLPLLAPEILFLALPTIAINVLSMFSPMYALDFVHYSVPLVPFAVIAAVYGCDRLLKLADRLRTQVDRWFLLLLLGGYLLFTSLFYHRIFGHTPLARTFTWPQVTQHHRVGHKVMKGIPDDATVSAQMSLNPHLSQREQVFVFPEFELADYIALDVSSTRDNSFGLVPRAAASSERGAGGAHSGDPSLTHTEYQQLVSSLLQHKEFGVVDGRDGYLILQRGIHTAQIPEAFYSAFLTDEKGVRNPVHVRFGDSRKLIGLWLKPGPGSAYYLRTFWKGSPSGQNDLHVYLALVDLSATPSRVVAVQELTASAFVPEAMWAEGRTVYDEVFVFFPSIQDQVALGLMVGTEDATERSTERLPVSVELGTDGIVADHAARVLLLNPTGNTW